MNELEPLPEELQRLLARTAPQAPLAGAAKARLWGRLSASAAALPAGSAAATAALLKWPLLAATLGLGVGAGVALDRFAFAPEPRVVVRTEVVKVEVPTPAPPPPAPTEAARPAPPRPVARTTPAPITADERQLIEAARTALIKRDAAAALNALARHRRSFAQGQLAEERDGLEVQALAQLGRRDEARTAARRFLASWPDSVFAPAVEAATAP
ncbi:MAG: hypothetical protein IPJ65_18375 [Archangiaceae bacterium]|nr:hypothetical protein [Archangiaceae bacterium]